MVAMVVFEEPFTYCVVCSLEVTTAIVFLEETSDLSESPCSRKADVSKSVTSKEEVQSYLRDPAFFWLYHIIKDCLCHTLAGKLSFKRKSQSVYICVEACMFVTSVTHM